MTRPRLVLVVGAALVLATGCGAGSSGGSAGRPSAPTVSPSSSAVAASPTIAASPIPMPTFAQFAAPSGSIVWALVGGLELFQSTDRGDTWQQRPLPSIPGVESISFVDDHQGWVMSSGSPATQCQVQLVWIWHTGDAGASWTRLNTTGVRDAQCKSGVSFVDPTHGFLVAWGQNSTPVIYRSEDGGRTWASQPLPDPPGFTTQQGGLTLTPGQVHAFGPVLLVSAGRYVFRSTDGGATWSYVASTPDGSAPIAFLTATRWLELGVAGQSKETLDAGATWHAYSSDYSQAAPVSPEFVFSDAQIGYATVRGGLQRTVDGGRHWVALHTPGTIP